MSNPLLKAKVQRLHSELERSHQIIEMLQHRVASLAHTDNVMRIYSGLVVAGVPAADAIVRTEEALKALQAHFSKKRAAAEAASETPNEGKTDAVQG